MTQNKHFTRTRTRLKFCFREGSGTNYLTKGWKDVPLLWAPGGTDWRHNREYVNELMVVRLTPQTTHHRCITVGPVETWGRA